jgi:hypothetical protein
MFNGVKGVDWKRLHEYGKNKPWNEFCIDCLEYILMKCSMNYKSVPGIPVDALCDVRLRPKETKVTRAVSICEKCVNTKKIHYE